MDHITKLSEYLDRSPYPTSRYHDGSRYPTSECSDRSCYPTFWVLWWIMLPNFLSAVMDHVTQLSECCDRSHYPTLGWQDRSRYPTFWVPWWIMLPNFLSAVIDHVWAWSSTVFNRRPVSLNTLLWLKAYSTYNVWSDSHSFTSPRLTSQPKANNGLGLLGNLTNYMRVYPSIIHK